jgi:hypothetical protein
MKSGGLSNGEFELAGEAPPSALSGWLASSRSALQRFKLSGDFESALLNHERLGHQGVLSRESSVICVTIGPQWRKTMICSKKVQLQPQSGPGSSPPSRNC